MRTHHKGRCDGSCVVRPGTSNHFATATYGHNDNWLILSLLILASFVAA